MKAYIGAKIIQATPQKHEDGREGYQVIYPDGYVSWSPKDTFELAYREVTSGEASLISFVDADHVEATPPESAHEHTFADYNGDADDYRCACGVFKQDFEREQREATPPHRRLTMFVVTRTRTRTEENEDGDLVAVTTLDSVNIEENVDTMREQLRLGDDRLKGVRIFHMGVDDAGTPAIGTEVLEE